MQTRPDPRTWRHTDQHTSPAHLRDDHLADLLGIRYPATVEADLGLYRDVREQTDAEAHPLTTFDGTTSHGDVRVQDATASPAGGFEGAVGQETEEVSPTTAPATTTAFDDDAPREDPALRNPTLEDLRTHAPPRARTTTHTPPTPTQEDRTGGRAAPRRSSPPPPQTPTPQGTTHPILPRSTCHLKGNNEDKVRAYAPATLQNDPVEAGRESVQDGEVAVQDGEAGVQDGEISPALTPEEAFVVVAGRPSLAPHLAVPATLREALVAWRPVLAEVPGFMALVQLQLFSSNVTRHGVVCPFEAVYRSFGLTEDQGYKLRLHTRTLLDLYRERVDDAFDYLGHSTQRRLARTIATDGIPDEIRGLADRFTRFPAAFDADRVLLITGASANRRNAAAALYQSRLDAAMTAAPTVPLPHTARIIQEYLNTRVGQQFFANGRYGVVTKLAEARARIEALKGTPAFDSEHKVDAAERVLTWMEANPTPVYLPCDHSPRLKADHYNQLMNLQGDVRRALYTDRDIELDLDKAHLASLVRIARDRGHEMPVTEWHLKASLAGDIDLWADLADRFDASVVTDACARRKTAKKCYGAVYGSTENNLLHSLVKEYADLTGQTHTYDPFRGVLDHPVVIEVLEVRDALLDRIEAEGGMSDAEGRWIETAAWAHKRPEHRARGVLSYVAASYEQVLVATAFAEAAREEDHAAAKDGRRRRFTIWLYQADGFTVRVDRKQAPGPIVERLQEAVAAKAAELGLITALTVQYGEV